MNISTFLRLCNTIWNRLRVPYTLSCRKRHVLYDKTHDERFKRDPVGAIMTRYTETVSNPSPSYTYRESMGNLEPYMDRLRDILDSK